LPLIFVLGCFAMITSFFYRLILLKYLKTKDFSFKIFKKINNKVIS
jgi:hypothetical protein